jgi:hypothetical protein
MTGIYVKALREGEWQQIEIEELTKEEFDSFQLMAERNGQNGWEYLREVVAWIRKNRDQPEQVDFKARTTIESIKNDEIERPEK